MEELLRVGVITSTHGIRGEVKVFPTTEDPKRFDKLKQCIIELKREVLNLEIESVKYFKQYVILKFKGYDNINDVEQFLKKDLLITRDNAIKCEPGEFFICDLIGLTVVTDDGITLGKLTNVLETGANNVYEVTAKDGKQILIPVIDECILNHDLEQQMITVHLLKGLLELN
jgi:16S rRNA processing protein RimM